jgi:hypothetical protein
VLHTATFVFGAVARTGSNLADDVPAPFVAHWHEMARQFIGRGGDMPLAALRKLVSACSYPALAY